MLRAQRWSFVCGAQSGTDMVGLNEEEELVGTAATINYTHWKVDETPD